MKASFRRFRGIAAPLPLTDINTDAIIPSAFLRSETSDLARGLFARWRFDEAGTERPDFVLNRAPFRRAEILFAGENFGCGSSREHAPWALLDFGISCVIAASFADIFYNNCFKNGILPIKLPQAIVDELMDDARKGANARLSIDLANQTITRPDGGVVKFDIDPFRKQCLLNGLDDVGLTLQKAGTIAAFEEKSRLGQPWLWS